MERKHDERPGDGRDEHRLRSRGTQRQASGRMELCKRRLAPLDENTREKEARKSIRAGKRWAPGLWREGDRMQKQNQRQKALKKKKREKEKKDGVSRKVSTPEPQHQVSLLGNHLYHEWYPRYLETGGFLESGESNAWYSAPVTSWSYCTAAATSNTVCFLNTAQAMPSP